MSFRAFLMLGCVALSACGSGSGLLAVAGGGQEATVRFANATATPLDLLVGGSATPATTNIAPGGSVACFTVPDATNPQISVRQTGTTTDLAGLSTPFSAGGRYTLVAYPGPSGVVQFVSIPDVGVAVTTRSALRVFHGSAALGLVDVYVTTPGAALGVPRISGLNYGASTGSFDVPAGATQVRLTGTVTTTVVFDAGTQTLEAGKSYTLVISSATAAMLIPDC
jgi:hypothetical protein